MTLLEKQLLYRSRYQVSLLGKKVKTFDRNPVYNFYEQPLKIMFHQMSSPSNYSTMAAMITLIEVTFFSSQYFFFFFFFETCSSCYLTLLKSEFVTSVILSVHQQRIANKINV